MMHFLSAQISSCCCKILAHPMTSLHREVGIQVQSYSKSLLQWA
jgi:hypothetical protein